MRFKVEFVPDGQYEYSTIMEVIHQNKGRSDFLKDWYSSLQRAMDESPEWSFEDVRFIMQSDYKWEFESVDVALTVSY